MKELVICSLFILDSMLPRCIQGTLKAPISSSPISPCNKDCLLALPKESLGYTTPMGVPPKESLGYTAPMGVPPKVQPMFVSST